MQEGNISVDLMESDYYSFKIKSIKKMYSLEVDVMYILVYSLEAPAPTENNSHQ